MGEVTSAIGKIPLDKLSSKEIKTLVINQQVAEIVEDYLDYCAKVIQNTFDKTGYDAAKFKEIGDELVLTPQELIELIDKLQVALEEI